MTTVTIERLGHQGDGIGPGPVFVPMSLPEEVVSGEIENSRMATPRILTPSPDRVRPVCRHFKACGGCALQHASDDFVSSWKANVVQQALLAHGLSCPVSDIITSKPNTRRRATISGRRTKKAAIVGFHGRRSGAIVEITDCQLLHPDLMAMLPALEEMTLLGATRKGEISFSITQSENGVDVAATGGKPIAGADSSAFAALAKRYRLARLTWDQELLALHALPLQRFGKASVAPPAGAFLQATKDGELALLSAVEKAAGSSKRIVDLFSGCGTFSLPLAANAEIHCVEGDAAMLEALDQGWRGATGLKMVTTEARDLYRRPLLPDELNRFGSAVIDPPRAGAKAQFEQIAKSTLTKVAAVSCNPVSFARDALILTEAGFRIERIDVIDQFRWSPHVELVAAFTKA